MHLWIDGQCLQTASRLRGIGRYVHELIRGLVKFHPEVDVSISFNAALADEAIVARDAVAAWIKPTNIHVWHGIAEAGEALFGYTPQRQLSELALAHHVACLQPDIALSASPFEGACDPAVPLLPTSSQKFPVGGIFYDAIPFRFSSKYLSYEGLKRHYDRRLSLHGKFDFMLAISEFSRREVEDIIPEVPVATIYAGISEDISRLARGLQPSALATVRPPAEKYLLYVGGLDWRKNVGRVVEAFALLPSPLKENLRFYLAGDAPEQMKLDISERWKRCSLPEPNLKILGHVSDPTLVELYAKARAVIQPSLMEGFGLTALEAMSCGSPVIAASAGALPEVIDMPEALFDPQNLQEMSLRIAQVCTDTALADSLAARGIVQAKKYSWKRSADLTIAALRQFQNGRTVAKCQNLDELRAISFIGVRKISINPNVSSRALAIAEPSKSIRSRLLVDVTATTKVDHGTGIQRVVKKIASALSIQDCPALPPLDLVYCDNADGFFRAKMSTAGKLCFGGKTLASKVICGPSDVLLMLDSSWEYHESQKLVFREARLRGAEVITTIYDLIPIKGSAFCDPGIPRIFSDWLRTALTFSTGVVCISRAVANEFIELLRAIHFPRVMKIGYWHLGADFTCSSFAVSGSKFKTPSPQFLMVGTIEPRKGHAVALNAFDALWAQGFQGSLILIGKRGWNMEHFISRIQSHPELGTRLHWIEGASDEELPRLYASCSALIAASYAEGFGLPIVEAAKYGKPIIASDIPVFREVTGESQVAAFFEVGSSEALADRIKTFSVQTDQSRIFENKQTRWITWGESAQQLADAVIGGNWYHTYQPTQGQVAQVGLGIGDVVMRRPLTEQERLHKLELVEGPLLAGGGKTLRIVVRLWNLSNVSWAGSGEDDAKFAVQLGYHVLREDGSPLQCDSAMTQIPFVVGPGDGLYLAVEVASNWLDRGAEFVDIEMQQEGVGWWGMPLRVSL